MYVCIYIYVCIHIYISIFKSGTALGALGHPTFPPWPAHVSWGRLPGDIVVLSPPQWGFPLFRDVSGHPVSGKSVKSGKI